MSHLPERYSLADFRDLVSRAVNAFALRIGAAARWVDELASDFVLWRATRFSWAQVRLARRLCFNLTIGGAARELRQGLLLRLRGRSADEAWALKHTIDELFPEQSEVS